MSARRRAKMRYPMSFRKMCNLAGIDPIKRVKLMKLIYESKNRGRGTN